MAFLLSRESEKVNPGGVAGLIERHGTEAVVPQHDGDSVSGEGGNVDPKSDSVDDHRGRRDKSPVLIRVFEKSCTTEKLNSQLRKSKLPDSPYLPSGLIAAEEPLYSAWYADMINAQANLLL